MPQETDRLKLPLPLGNETVNRESINEIFEKIDAGVATQADLDTLREAVSQMDIPDASLTQKGKVQLSSKTDGTSETVAATEKAVRDAKNASLPRTGGVMTGRLIMNQWGTFSGSSNGSVLYGSNCFLDGLTFRYENNHTNLGARGIYMRYTGGAGPEVYMFETGPVATTAGGAFTPSLTRIVNTADSWQKHQLTDDNGKNKLTSGIDLNSLMVNGQYNGNNLTNAPLPATADMWWYIEVQCHTNGEGYVLQRASRLNGGTPTLYIRTRENGVWSSWSPDVFQSGVDAKNGVVGAINAKGGSASTNDTWAQLTTKINAINTGKRFAQGRAVLGGSSGTTTMMSVLGLAFQPSTVLYSVYNASDPHHAALGTTVNVSIRREQGSYSSSGISTTSSGFEARFTYWYNNLTVDWIAFE